MQSKNNRHDPHIDWSRFGKKSREEINAEGAAEKKRLGLTGKSKRLRAYIGERIYEIPTPDVRSIRTRLKLSQAEFARRFCLSHRTVQQWEQHRAVPDMPARILLKAIENDSASIAKAADDVRADLRRSEVRPKPISSRTGRTAVTDF